MPDSHAHSHSHSHSHTYHHPVQADQVNTAFIIGITLNFLFVIAEVIAGLSIHSLSLLSDAGHNLADVASLALSLIAFRLVKIKSNDRFTYGYRKTTILAALFNAVILLMSIGVIVYEAVQRLFNPEILPGKTIAFVALIGILINAGTAFLFFKQKDSDINIKSAYLHLAADALFSFALVVGGIIIFYTGWYWIDSALGVGVGIFIVINTWGLLKYSFRLSMDGVPEGIDINSIKKIAQSISGVSAINHIHVWAMSTTQNALTAHVSLEKNVAPDQELQIKRTLKHELEHLNIQHVTLETEREPATTNNHSDDSCPVDV